MPTKKATKKAVNKTAAKKVIINITLPKKPALSKKTAASKAPAKKTTQKAATKKLAAKLPAKTARRILRKLGEKAVKTAKAANRAVKKAIAPKPSRVPALPYVLKDTFLQVTIAGKPFTLNSTHPTFQKMSQALLAKNWKAVPRLVTVAQSLMNDSRGNVKVENGNVFYKGTKIDDSLTRRIVDLIQHGKKAAHMLLFMDNLYQNESPEAKGEFFDWLRNNDLPITDDGCLLAYKSVDGNLKDEHTHTIDNSPGKVISMQRNRADTNWRTQCSSGFHVCSKQYGLYGSRVLAVKVNPKDVIAANSGKMRVLRYEVIRELGRMEELKFKQEGFSELENQIIVEVKKERKELIAMLLKAPAVKRLLNKGKLQPQSIKRGNYARLKSMAQRFDLIPKDDETK